MLHAVAWRIGGGPPKRRAWKSGGHNKSLSGWLSTSTAIDVDIRAGLQALRARSRHQCQNDDHARNFLRMVKTNLIGPPGIRMQARVLAADGTPDKLANTAIEDAWRDWGRRGVCEVTGLLSWRQLQRLWVETIARDGEALLRHRPGWENGHGYAVQLLDAENLDITFNETLGQNRVTMGVELDGNRRPVAYHLAPEGAATLGQAAPLKRTRVPASEIEHVFLPEWVYQTRGIPWMSTSLTRMVQLSGYEEAELTAARAGASKFGHYKTDPEADDQYTGDGEDAAGAPFEDIRPGEIGVLPPGWEFEGFDPTHPTTAFEAFTKTTLRGIASGLGVSYNDLASDLEGVNYTSLRHGQLNARDVWATLQDWVVDTLCEPVHHNWLPEALVKRAIAPPQGAPYPVAREREFRRVTWQPRRWAWVDPVKEAQAQREQLEMRIRSPSDIIRESGRDPDEVWEEIARDAARMEEIGVPPPTTKQAAAEPAPPPQGAPDDEDD